MACVPHAAAAIAAILLAWLPPMAPIVASADPPAKAVRDGFAVAEANPAPAMRQFELPRFEARYGKLLKPIEVACGETTYVEVFDYGRYEGTFFAGHSDLPVGYWTPVTPLWRLWGECLAPDEAVGETALPIEAPRPVGPAPCGFEDPFAPMAPVLAAPVDAALPVILDDSLAPAPEPVRFRLGGPAATDAGRSWGPEQATGPPNTPVAGDYRTAWASRTPDDADEWLELEYEALIEPRKVLVYESYNPGALVKVVAYTPGDMDGEVWSGKDPAAQSGGVWVAEIPVGIKIQTRKLRLYFDSKGVAGWNEIDAVGVVDPAGKTHWAKAAKASSTYAPDAGLVDDAVEFGGGPLIIGGLGGPAGAPAIPAGDAVPAAPPLPAFPAAPGDERDARIRELEEKVRVLEEVVARLRRRLESDAP